MSLATVLTVAWTRLQTLTAGAPPFLPASDYRLSAEEIDQMCKLKQTHQQTTAANYAGKAEAGVNEAWNDDTRKSPGDEAPRWRSGKDVRLDSERTKLFPVRS